MTWPVNYDPWGRLSPVSGPDGATVRENERRARLVDTQRRGRPLDRVATTEPHELPRAGTERVMLDDGEEAMFV